tara:strand:- start:47 stop:250 length:204 start_codon:yes stop_codon:yes gene_type:complete
MATEREEVDYGIDPNLSDFDKSLAWLKEFIDDVEFDAWEKWGDRPWLGDGTKEEFLKHLDTVSANNK